MRALEAEDHLLFAAVDDGGEVLDDVQCRRIFDLLAMSDGVASLPDNVAQKIKEIAARRQADILEEMGTRNARWFDIEIEKLEHWAEDRRGTIKAELDELDEALKSGT